MIKAEKRSGSYSTRVSLTDPLTGERTQKRVTARTKRELDAKVADLKVRWNNGTFIQPNETILADWLEEWLRTANIKESSRYAHGRVMARHIATDHIGRVPIGLLKLVHLQDFVDRKVAEGYKPTYVRRMIAPINHAYVRALKLGLVVVNPCTGLDMPRMVKGSALKIFSEDQTRHFLDSVRDDSLCALWVLAVTVGLRRGELVALRWTDVDLERGTLTVSGTVIRTANGWHEVGEPKSASSRRTIHLPRICLDALRRHRTDQLERRLRSGSAWIDSGVVFDTGLGEQYRDPTPVLRRFYRIVDRLGLPKINVHGLRHTAATNMLKKGTPVHVVAQVLGHSSPAITLSVYAHVLADMQLDAAARIDAMFGT